ncbi:cation efflux protein, partial [Blastocladiella britannica]
RKLWIASGLCFTFFLVELIGGIMSNSLAILSDSFHLLSDLAGFIISIASIYLARRKATKRHSFGFHRAEILGALASVLLIWIMTVFLVNEAIDRVQHPRPINGPMMLGIAVIGLVVNLILIFALGHGHAHAHGAEEAGHGHSHAHGGNMNLRAAVIHIIGDIVSSLGVIISSVIVTFWPEWVIVDPICTFLFSVIVMFTTFRLVKDSMVVLMEGTPSHIDPAAVEHDLASVPFVVSVHDLHIWTLTVGKEALAVHLCVSRSASDPSHVADGVLAAAHEILCTKYGVHHATIQIEA